MYPYIQKMCKRQHDNLFTHIISGCGVRVEEWGVRIYYCFKTSILPDLLLGILSYSYKPLTSAI